MHRYFNLGYVYVSDTLRYLSIKYLFYKVVVDYKKIFE